MFWNWLALVCLLLDSCSLNSAHRHKHETSAAIESIGTITVKNSDATSNQTEAKEDAMLDDLLNSQMAVINQSMPPPAISRFKEVVRKVMKKKKEATRTGTCIDVYKAIVEDGVKLEDPEFGSDSPFFKSFSTFTTCRMVFEGAKEGGTMEQIKADMQTKCPDTRGNRKVFEDGSWYECHPFMPKRPTYGLGFGYFGPSQNYKAMCQCHVQGTLSSPAPSCATISQDMLKNNDWIVHDFSTGYCTISGFRERTTELTRYLKLPNDLKEKAWPENLEATFPIGADNKQFLLLLFALSEDLRMWTKKQKLTKTLNTDYQTVFDKLDREAICNIDQNTLETFFPILADKEGLKVPDDVMQFYATKAQSVLQGGACTLEKLDEAWEKIRKMEFKNDKHVVLEESEHRMTRELCLKAMLKMGCPGTLVEFSQGVEEPGISSDRCKCVYKAK